MTTQAIATPDAIKAAELSPRALYRLRIVARFLMNSRRLRFSGDKDMQVSQVLTAARKQPDQAQLRELVDWVEAFDNYPHGGHSIA